MKYLSPFVVALLFAMVPSHAFAYLDPGTGSMALQLIVAGLLGAIFTIKTWWRTIVAYCSRVFGKSSSESK